MREYDQPQILNIGVGEDLTIRELAELLKAVVGFPGKLRFDPSKPDGTPQKLLDVSRIHALGWRARTPLRDGLAETYAWYVRSLGNPPSART
jgi:GDP-L-fucose synthase